MIICSQEWERGFIFPYLSAKGNYPGGRSRFRCETKSGHCLIFSSNKNTNQKTFWIPKTFYRIPNDRTLARICSWDSNCTPCSTTPCLCAPCNCIRLAILLTSKKKNKKVEEKKMNHKKQSTV